MNNINQQHSARNNTASGRGDRSNDNRDNLRGNQLSAPLKGIDYYQQHKPTTFHSQRTAKQIVRTDVR